MFFNSKKEGNKEAKQSHITSALFSDKPQSFLVQSQISILESPTSRPEMQQINPNHSNYN